MLTPLYLLLPVKLFKMDWSRVSLLLVRILSRFIYQGSSPL